MKVTIAERIILDKDLEDNTSSFSYISYRRFLDILDEWEHDYLNDYEADIPILEFFVRENIDVELFLKINPLYVVRELNKCNVKRSILNRFSKDFSPRFKILMGICEKITLVNLPKPIFKYLDIVREKDTNRVFCVMDYNKSEDYYVFEDLNGRSDSLERIDMERRFAKIGEVSRDVLKSLNPNLK